MKFRKSALAAAAITMLATTAFAATTGGTVTVSGTVAAPCTMTASPVSFGSVNSGGGAGGNFPVSASGTATVTCAVPWSITSNLSTPLTIGGVSNGNQISVLALPNGSPNGLTYYQNISTGSAYPGNPSPTIVALMYAAFTTSGMPVRYGNDLTNVSSFGPKAPIGTGAFASTINLTLNY